MTAATISGSVTSTAQAAARPPASVISPATATAPSGVAIEHRHEGALVGQEVRGGPAHPAGRTGDHGHLPDDRAAEGGQSGHEPVTLLWEAWAVGGVGGR